MLTDTELAALESLCAAATQFKDDYEYYGGPDPVGVDGYRKRLFELTEALPLLISEVRRLRAEYHTICVMLGWLNDPPIQTIEADIRALKHLASKAAAPQGDGE